MGERGVMLCIQMIVIAETFDRRVDESTKCLDARVRVSLPKLESNCMSILVQSLPLDIFF